MKFTNAQKYEYFINKIFLKTKKKKLVLWLLENKYIKKKQINKMCFITSIL